MPVTILFVCAGNTCRSPMAAAIASMRFGSAVVSQSAGIECGSNMQAAEKAIEIMRERGVDLSAHRSTDIECLDCRGFDLVVAMTPGIAHELLKLNLGIRRVVKWNIPDPYGRDLTTYRETAKALDQAMGSLEF